MKHISNSCGSHPALFGAVSRTTGRVLELGMGYDSTPQLHEMCRAKDRKLLSLDNHAEWFNLFTELRADFHSMSLEKVWRERLIELAVPARWSVVLVDQDPDHQWPTREQTVELFKDCATFIVCHDVDYLGQGKELDPAHARVFGQFRFCYLYKFLRPWTAVLSNSTDYGGL